MPKGFPLGHDATPSERKMLTYSRDATATTVKEWFKLADYETVLASKMKRLKLGHDMLQQRDNFNEDPMQQLVSDKERLKLVILG